MALEDEEEEKVLESHGRVPGWTHSLMPLRVVRFFSFLQSRAQLLKFRLYPSMKTPLKQLLVVLWSLGPYRTELLQSVIFSSST